MPPSFETRTNAICFLDLQPPGQQPTPTATTAGLSRGGGPGGRGGCAKFGVGAGGAGGGWLTCTQRNIEGQNISRKKCCYCSCSYRSRARLACEYGEDLWTQGDSRINITTIGVLTSTRGDGTLSVRGGKPVKHRPSRMLARVLTNLMAVSLYHTWRTTQFQGSRIPLINGSSMTESKVSHIVHMPQKERAGSELPAYMSQDKTNQGNSCFFTWENIFTSAEHRVFKFLHGELVRPFQVQTRHLSCFRFLYEFVSSSS